jgi:hypothetical protein
MKNTLLKLAILAVTAFAASTTFAAPSLVLHSPSSASNYVAYSDLKTPEAAQAYCLSKAGHLAVLNTNNEIIEVQKLLALDISQNYWFGTQALTASTAFTTVTNQPFYQSPSFTYYLPSLPSTTNLYLKANVTSTSPSLYFTADPSSLAYFVCEFENSPI